MDLFSEWTGLIQHEISINNQVLSDAIMLIGQYPDNAAQMLFSESPLRVIAMEISMLV